MTSLYLPTLHPVLHRPLPISFATAIIRLTQTAQPASQRCPYGPTSSSSSQLSERFPLGHSFSYFASLIKPFQCLLQTYSAGLSAGHGRPAGKLGVTSSPCSLPHSTSGGTVKTPEFSSLSCSGPLHMLSLLERLPSWVINFSHLSLRTLLRYHPSTLVHSPSSNGQCYFLSASTKHHSFFISP